MTAQDQGDGRGAVREALPPPASGLPPDPGFAIDLDQVEPAGDSGTRLMLIVGIGSAPLLAPLTAAVVQHSSVVSAADIRLHSWVLVTRSDVTIEVARWLTWGGATIVTLPALIVIGALASPPERHLRSRIGSGVLLAGIASLCVYLGLLINGAVGGMRPPEGNWAGSAGGPAFPSGHTTAATVFAVFAVWALAGRMRTVGQRTALVSLGVAYAVIVGLTRLWLGVHWPSDVLGGWLLGLASLTVIGVVAARRRWSSGIGSWRS